jgi:ribonuclease-3
VDRSPRAPERELTTSLDTLASLLDELPDDLAKQAFTHASWVDRRADSYERLAFLGDVVLSLAVSTAIYPRYESYGAGRLTKLRAQAVSEQACVEVARSLDIPERIEASAPEGVGRNADVLTDSDRVLASVCEAVIGAAYLAFGIDRVQPAVVAAFEEQIEDARKNPVDHKSVLQERLAQRSEIVEYRIDSEEGPPHDRSFVAVAEVAGNEIGRGEGKTKKAAEQEAADRALDRLDDEEQES